MNSSIPLRAMAALFFFTLMLLQVPAVRSADSATMPAPTDRLIVQMREPGAGAQLASTLAAVAGVELSYIRAFDEDTHIFGLAQALPHAEVEALAERLRDDPEVLLATPDTLLFPAFEASDPLYQEYGWPLWAPALGSYGIDLSRAWDLTQGDPNLVIAILDTGALLNHEDLIGRHLATNPGYDMLSDLARAGDGNGRDPDPSDPGDFVTSNEAASGQPLAGCTVSDSSWHGAHVAGIIGATANNARGIAGVNQSSPLLYLRVLGKCGGYISDIADGVRWAVGLNVSGLPRNPNPARVINMSLGGSGTCNSFLQQAINDANNQGAVVIAAAGNSNQAADTYQPANCGGTITVAAVGRTGWRARYSNYGPLVDLAAPGGDRSVDTQIFSTVNSGRTVPVNDSYSAYQGTSMATPHVAGVVSLMLAVNPALTAAEVLSILQATATPFPAESSCIGLCGAGILNGGAAVDAATRRAYSSIALAQLHPLSLHFGGQLLGTASATQLLTLSNRGGQPLTASALQFSGAFRRQGGTCPNQFPFTLASEMSCTFGVIFNPDTIGQQVGQVLLTSNSVASPHSVPLSGEGLVAAATFSPAALSFAQQQVGTQSASQRITLASTGSAPLTIQGITISGDFVRSGGNCPTTFPAALAAGQSCTLDVRFVPTTATRTRGLVSLSSNALAAAAPVGLFGTGSAPALGFNPLALTFAPQIVGTTSPTQSITLSNPGSAPLSLEALSLTGDYERVGGSCATSFPATLAALASCSVEVRFVPTRRGTQEGQLSLFSNVPGGPYGVALHGNGLAPALSLTPQQIHFGGQTVGSPSLTQTLILSSTGDVPLQIAALTLDNEAF
ncbi:MAG: choice-of-anchor D domain-containing protein, partial [Candidatus Viridilinea halotolerans]